jgi:hypothetical protein
LGFAAPARSAAGAGACTGLGISFGVSRTFVTAGSTTVIVPVWG